MADDSVQIRPIASKDIYPIRRTVLYPAGPDDAIYIPDDDAAIHLGAYVTNQKPPRLSESEEPSNGQLTAVISLFNDEFPSHLKPALGSSTDPDLGFSPALRFRKFACLPDFQNRGIGSLLFRSVINYARDDDLTTMTTTEDMAISTHAPGFDSIFNPNHNSSVVLGKPGSKRRMVWCAARSSAKDWYIKRGMKVYGDAYLKNNIEFVIMGIIV